MAWRCDVAAVRAVPFMRTRGALGAALAASLLPGCDFSFRHGDGDGRVEGRVRGETSSASLEAIGPPGGGGGAVRAGDEVAVRFSLPLDPMTARGAVRVEDLARGRDPVDVSVRVDGDRLLVAGRAEGGFRAGARLRLTVVGRPSVRALRARNGAALSEDLVGEVDVVSRRRSDRVAPAVVATTPVDGATGVDPDAPIQIVFSEAMDPASLRAADPGLARTALRLQVDGTAFPAGVHLDRHRTTATVHATAPGLPGDAEVVVEISPRVRDRDGNRLSVESPRRLRFRTAPRPPERVGGGVIVESFDDDGRADPAGTTARWADALRPGALIGETGPRVLVVAAPGVPRVVSLDAAGGMIRIPVFATDLGPEARTLSALALAGVPAAAAGEILDPVVRVAPLLALASPFGDRVEGGAWRVAAEGQETVGAIGPDAQYVLPFRTPVHHDGITDLVVEISWSGVTGPVLLVGHARGTAGDTAAAVPDLRFTAVGDRAVALSRWIDGGGGALAWLSPRVRPTAGAHGARVEIQAAHGDAAGPDEEARASSWTAAPPAEGLPGRWVRFRVRFDDPATGPPAIVDDVLLPYVSR